MADAWSTVVSREPEFSDSARDRILALMAWEAGRCPSCGNHDCLVPLPRDLRNVTWAEHDGRVFEVVQYRCLACGAADLIKRDWHTRHEKDKPQPGQAAPGDGRMFFARPAQEV